MKLMSGLAEVRTRLETDPAFYESLLADPIAALEPYPLTGDEVLALARELDQDQPRRRPREGRPSM